MKFNLKTLTFFSVACAIQLGLAHPVSLEVAQRVAQVQFQELEARQLLPAASSKELEVVCHTSKSPQGLVPYYVFNSKKSTAFVIVSGSDLAIPVLAYSYESKFDVSDIPSSIEYLLSTYEQEIREAE